MLIALSSHILCNMRCEIRGTDLFVFLKGLQIIETRLVTSTCYDNLTNVAQVIINGHSHIGKCMLHI